MIPTQHHPSHLPILNYLIRLGAASAILTLATIIGASTLCDARHASPTHQVSNRAVMQDQLQDQSEPAQDSDDGDTGIVECVITLISGRTITGELIRKNSLIVVVGVNGIETTFQQNGIAKIVILPPIEERYIEMRAAIPDKDIESRLALIEWLRARRAYTLAIKELESVLVISPSNPRAKLLLVWLTEYKKLGPAQRTSPNRTGSKPADKDRVNRGRPIRNSITPLTPEQINLIKVYEIDLRDPPKLKVLDETLMTLMNRKPDAFSPNKEDRDKLFKLPEVEKLKILFTHKARDLYSQVLVLEDPQSIENFKENVHAQRGWLINACATTRCHGGVDAGRFQLINVRSNSDETVYTNFMILERFMLANGSPLINYHAPERSALLQMAMISKNTLTPHPQIPAGFPGTGFRPIFRSTRDRKYRDAIEWIRSMYQPRPDYESFYPAQSEPEPVQSEP